MAFKYKVLNKKNRWEEWTGSFSTELDAKTWFKLYGKFHLDRGYTLGLFKSNKLLESYSQK